MADDTYSNANAIAQIKLIYPFNNGDIPKVVNQQSAYDTWVTGGGTPDVLGKPLHTSGQFQVVVTRFDSSQYAQTDLYKQYMRGWRKMPLFAGDIVECGPNFCATVELLIGGFFYILPNKGVRIDSDSNVIPLGGWKPRATLWEKFSKTSKPLTIQRRGGSFGIKG